MSDPLVDIKPGSVVRLYPGREVAWISNIGPCTPFITKRALRILTALYGNQPLVNECLHGLDDEPHGLATMVDQ